MNELGLTHIDSLDSEVVNIPGLDVDSALEKTIKSGKKKLRNKRIIKGASIVAVFSLLGFTFLGVSSFLNSEDGNIRSNAIQSAQKQFQKVKTTDIEVIPAEEIPTQEVPTPTVATAPVVTPKLVGIKSFGNAGLCNIIASTDPGPGGVVIGPSTSLQTWNPSVGQTRVEVVPNSGRQLVLKNVANNNATYGTFVDLISGFDSSSSFANITTFGFKYCESGYVLEITPRNNAGGYAISTTSL